MYPDLSYIDLHCDTAYELYHKGVGLTDGVTAVSWPLPYRRYAQFFAVWSDRRLDDEACYRDFLAITEHFRWQLPSTPPLAPVTTGDEMEAAWSAGRGAAFGAVEDARLLAGDLTRLEVLHRYGVRYLTLMWQGESCIGGAWDTEVGLTAFGRAVVCRAFELGILIDLSHASEQAADEVLTMAQAAGVPVIASHSNAYAVYPHRRNLRDGQFARLIATDGIVGLNLCAHHITNCEAKVATPENLLLHIDHFLSLGGERHLAIGGDLDGAPLPLGIEHAGDVARLAELMAHHGYSDALIRNLFYENARRFLNRWLR